MEPPLCARHFAREAEGPTASKDRSWPSRAHNILRREDRYHWHSPRCPVPGAGGAVDAGDCGQGVLAQGPGSLWEPRGCSAVFLHAWPGPHCVLWSFWIRPGCCNPRRERRTEPGRRTALGSLTPKNQTQQKPSQWQWLRRTKPACRGGQGGALGIQGGGTRGKEWPETRLGGPEGQGLRMNCLRGPRGLMGEWIVRGGQSHRFLWDMCCGSGWRKGGLRSGRSVQAGARRCLEEETLYSPCPGGAADRGHWVLETTSCSFSLMKRGVGNIGRISESTVKRKDLPDMVLLCDLGKARGAGFRGVKR